MLTHGVNSAVSNSSSNVYANAAVSAASTGYSVAKGVGEVGELKDFITRGIGINAERVHSSLPNFIQLLSYSCRRADFGELAAITNNLQANGTLSGKYRIEVSKLSFEGGIKQLASPAANSTAAKDKAAQQPFVYAELGGQALSSQVASSSGNNVSTSISSNNSNNSQSQAASGTKWSLQTRGLLVDLAAAQGRDYNGEIDQIANNISKVVGDRMRGLIFSGIISPITSTLVSSSLSYVFEKTGLEKSILFHLGDPATIELIQQEQEEQAKQRQAKEAAAALQQQELLLQALAAEAANEANEAETAA